VFWLVITWIVWKYMLDELKTSLSPVRAAAAGAWSTWLFTSAFNVTVFYPLPFLLFLLTDLRYPRREKAGKVAQLQRKPRPTPTAGMAGGAAPGPA
jgi:hypothetical protein